MELDLKLHGDRIKLGRRPISSTASSKSAYLAQGPSRPVSAVPMLALYKTDKDDYIISARSKRPYSADNYTPTKKGILKPYELTNADTSSLQSIEELEKDLPSNDLLKSLISEPIISWRGGRSHSTTSVIRKDKVPKIIRNLTPTPTSTPRSTSTVTSNNTETSSPNLTPTLTPTPTKQTCITTEQTYIPTPGLTQQEPSIPPYQSDGSESSESIIKRDEIPRIISSATPITISTLTPISTPTQQPYIETSTQPSQQLCIQRTTQEPCLLKPGLTTKPPLPTIAKRDVRFTENEYSEMQNYNSDPDERIIGYRQEIANIDKMINLPDFSSNKINTQEISKINTSEISKTDICTEVSTLSTPESPIQYQNWIADNNVERQTDQIFEKLKAQQRELGIGSDEEKEEVNIYDCEKQTNLLFGKLKQQEMELGLENFETKTQDDIKFERFFSDVAPINLPSAKVITLVEMPIEKPKSKCIIPTSKSNVKTACNNSLFNKSSSNCKATLTDKSNSTIKNKHNVKFEASKPKFKPQIMRCNKDAVSLPLEEDVSWMSSRSKSDVDVWEEVVTKHSPKPQNSSSPISKDSHLQNSDYSKDVPVKDCNGEISEGTYDEIEAVLEILEAESQRSQSKIQDIKNIVSEELNATINSIPDCNKKKVEGQGIGNRGAQSVDSDSRVSSAVSDGSNRSRIESIKEQQNRCSNFLNGGNFQNADDVRCTTVSNNFKDILFFLDEVDRSSAQSISNAKERMILATQLMDGSIRLDTIPKLEDLLNHTPVELSNQIIDLNLRLKEKSSSIKVLQDELSSVRDHVVRISRQTEKIVKDKLRQQKDEADATIRRHQKFIDQLIADKKNLNQQCETLVHEMKLMEDKFNANTKAAEHRHQVELQKVKEMHVAGEKIRRERWLDTKTQKIKEMTVKSIEPEFQAMTNRHEKELAELRGIHKREIEDIELKNARKMQQQCEAIREQMTEEREKALAHEREVMRLRYESMVESEEKGYQEQRKRLQQEHSNRMEECEAREAAVALERERSIKHIQDEYEDKLQAALRRHAAEIKLLKETTEMETETWKSNLRKQQELQLVTKEQSIKQQCRRERDREIETVIERLEAEASETRAQTESAAEARIRRIKEKYENEIKELEMSERESKNKYSETKTKLLESEDAIINLKASLKHLEAQLKETQDLYEKLSGEKSTMRQGIREEMKVEISGLEKEIERIKSDRDTELQQVYARVKVAITRKDEMLAELSRDHMALKEKCKYLESMLEQQRKEYLIK